MSEVPVRPTDVSFAPLLEHLAEACFVADARGQIAYLNRSAETLLGYSRAAIIGRSLVAVFPQTTDDAFGRLIQSAQNTRQHAEGEMSVIATDTRYRVRVYPDPDTLSVLCTPAPKAATTPTPGEGERLRDEFFASVSHELRTPLTAINAALGLLDESSRERLRAEERSLLNNARRNVKHLHRLVDDLVVYNQFRERALHLDRQPLDLRSVIVDAVASVHILLAQKGQRVELDLPPSLPVEGDQRRLAQVLVNLLDNAHRHTPSGTVISVRGEIAGGEVRVQVCDTGPGIPRIHLGRVFERFTRINMKASGAGLGLAIVRGIVEMHGGRIWAESDPGSGSTFTFTLPLDTGGG